VLQYRTASAVHGGLNMNARISWTHLLEGFSIDLPGAPKDRFAGEIGSARDRVNGLIGFSTERVGVSFFGQLYRQVVRGRCDARRVRSRSQGDLCRDEFYLDSQVTFTPSRAYELFLGVDNLLDNDAPEDCPGFGVQRHWLGHRRGRL
jgi:hypothetical protein